MEQNNEKQRDGELIKKSPFLRWLDNYWYHYKTATLIISFFVVVLLICSVQMCSSQKEDTSLLYAGHFLMTGSESSGVNAALDVLLPEDYNGDGIKHVSLVTYHVKSEDALRIEATETHEDGETYYVDRSYYSQQYENYNNFLLTGEASVCIVDEWLYNKLVSEGRVKKLSDVLGKVPDDTVGEYGIRLGSTGAYKKYNALQILPEDTVVCLLSPYVFGVSSDEKLYGRAVEMFKTLAEVS